MTTTRLPFQGWVCEQCQRDEHDTRERCQRLDQPSVSGPVRGCECVLCGSVAGVLKLTLDKRGAYPHT